MNIYLITVLEHRFYISTNLLLNSWSMLMAVNLLFDFVIIKLNSRL